MQVLQDICCRAKVTIRQKQPNLRTHIPSSSAVQHTPYNSGVAPSILKGLTGSTASKGMQMLLLHKMCTHRLQSHMLCRRMQKLPSRGSYTWRLGSAPLTKAVKAEWMRPELTIACSQSWASTPKQQDSSQRYWMLYGVQQLLLLLQGLGGQVQHRYCCKA